MKVLILFAFVVFAKVCEGGLSVAPITDGNSLARVLKLVQKVGADEGLTSIEIIEAFHALGYIHGFLDDSFIWSRLGSTPPFKLPNSGIPVEQFEQVIRKYLSDHPAKLHEPAAFLMHQALVDAFPNPDQNKLGNH